MGIIGCGDIANRTYVPNSHRFQQFDVVACADIDAERARALADGTALESLSIELLLARDDVDVVLNLTSPAAHRDVSLAAIEAGKHVYSEKPLATDPSGASEILDAAASMRVRVGCSPDTFLGAGLATARRLVGEGILGLPISAEVVMQHFGPERFPHPRPQAFYAPGGGPMFDMGPYYLTPLVRLFGPIAAVEAVGRVTYATRTVMVGPDAGGSIPVTTPSHLASLLCFENGLLATMTMSFDCAFWTHTFTLNGADASMRLPDPDEFGGPLSVRRSTDDEWADVELDPGITDDGRGVGLADFAQAIRDDRPHRASAAIGLHVVEVMSAVLAATTTRGTVPVPKLDVSVSAFAGELPGVDAARVPYVAGP